MAKQPDTSDDKDEGGAAKFVETMRRLLRVTKGDVQQALDSPRMKSRRAAAPQRRVK